MSEQVRNSFETVVYNTARDTLELFLEYRDQHGYDELHAQQAALADLSAALPFSCLECGRIVEPWACFCPDCVERLAETIGRAVSD